MRERRRGVGFGWIGLGASSRALIMLRAAEEM